MGRAGETGTGGAIRHRIRDAPRDPHEAGHALRDRLPEALGTPGRTLRAACRGQKSSERPSSRLLADTLGYNTVWVVEHHFRARAARTCPASEVLLGGLATVTENIKMGFGVTLTPFGFINPARIAEKVATVDILSNGRVR